MARGDVLIIELPSPGESTGREEAGRRPAIAVQADEPGLGLPTLLVVPCTGQLGALRFPHTFQVQPSSQNGLTHSSVLLVFQLRAIDTGRVIQRIGRLEREHLDRLDGEMRELLQLS